jgi:hypothetical protein
MSLVNWINHKFQRNFNAQDIDAVRDFTLLWNVLEGGVFNRSFSILAAAQKFQQHQFNDAPFLPFYNYFRDRYIDASGQGNYQFDSLEFRRNDRKTFVEQVLANQASSAGDKALALAIIIYRLRNNLFHGIKPIYTIDQQRTNFENANGFLMELLNYFV